MSHHRTWTAWWRDRAEDLCALLLLSMASAFMVQIVSRYVLNQPQGWTVEYVTIAWLWGILFGYAFVVRDADVIRMDLLVHLLPPRTRAGADVAAGLLVATVLAASLPASVEYVQFMGIERTAFLQLPFDLVFSIYIPFVITVIVRTLLDVRRAWRVLRTAQAPSAATKGSAP